jgi:predicted metal-dependent enzyme (double-stranded beta helix superfamily)
MTWLSLPARDLDAEELETLVNELAAQPGRWRALVSFSDDERHYVSLYRDDHVDVWLLCWTPSNDTGWHDHDISAGAVCVVEGALQESSPRIGGQAASRTVPAGRSFSFGPDHIHRLAGHEQQSVSIHAYSPPLWRLGAYAIDREGVMRRMSISYADELRPLEDAAVA